MFLRKVKTTIQSHALLRKEGRVIVAISGGADSVALLSALMQLGYDCVGAHCNFHLRGEESVRDMRHVESVASALGCDLYVKDFDVPAQCRRTGQSVEMACRELRYKWFHELLDRDYGQAIAVGHHREDQVETFFLNLLRGSGVAGLAGMRYRNQYVVRPLLDCSKAEIVAYLQAQGLQYVTDSSNLSTDYMRNRLRLRLLPLMDELFDGATDAVLRSMACLRDNADLLAEAVAAKQARFTDQDSGEIDLRAIEAEPNAAALLFEMLKPQGFNATHIRGMLKAARTGQAASFEGDRCVREVDHGILRAPSSGAIPKAGASCFDVHIPRDVLVPIGIEITIHDISEFAPGRDPSVLYLDETALQGNPRWQIRHWQRADRFKPFGMNGSKLVSDLFAAQRFSAERKRSTWLLTRDGEIVWVIGVRAGSAFTVGPGTRRYLRLKVR